MTNQNIDGRLRRLMEQTAPNDVADIFSRIERKDRKVIPMEKSKKQRKPRVGRMIAAACLAAALVSGTGVFYQRVYAVSAVVSIDVNPSIELKVNAGGKVLSCLPMNPEALEVLTEMDGGRDLEGAKLDVAVNALVGALVRHGYLEALSSSILISVEDNNATRRERLRQEVETSVDAVVSQAVVLTRTYSRNAGLEEVAKTKHISSGKAALVEELIRMNGELDFDDLSALTVEELHDMAETGAPGLPIGMDEARRIATEAAGAQNLTDLRWEVESELDERIPHYEVELAHPSLGKVEYKIGAYDGSILDVRTERLSSPQPGAQQPATPAADIGEKAAIAAALAHAGLEEKDVNGLKAEPDVENGRRQYEIGFKVGGMEYEYHIDAGTGAVVKAEKEWDDDAMPAVQPTPQPGAQQPATPAADIGEKAAIAAALAHAGLEEKDVNGLKAEPDVENGRRQYEIGFKVGGMEYEYHIDAGTGAVVKAEKEWDDDAMPAVQPTPQPGAQQPATPAADIGEKAAIAAALAHAGLEEKDVNGLKAEPDVENGRRQYEIGFKAGGMEYEYHIDAGTGAVVKAEKEWDSPDWDDDFDDDDNWDDDWDDDFDDDFDDDDD